MPTKFFLKGGGAVLLKGSSRKESMTRKLFSGFSFGEALNGHIIGVVNNSIQAWEEQTEAEFAENEKKAKEDQASKCRRCGATLPREAHYCHNCGSAQTKKEEPKRVIPGGN
jgi:ribosomal protein L40E